MINVNETRCPHCGGELRYYDKVRRIIRTKKGLKDCIFLRRLKCVNCKSIHREINNCIFPYKHYESEIILGVLEGLINSDTIGFENNPSEQTIKRWYANFTNAFMKKN